MINLAVDKDGWRMPRTRSPSDGDEHDRARASTILEVEQYLAWAQTQGRSELEAALGHPAERTTDGCISPEQVSRGVAAPHTRVFKSLRRASNEDDACRA